MRLIRRLFLLYTVLAMLAGMVLHSCMPENHEADPSVWRCVQYVPGSADCEVMQRR
jgi:hypothetical protein